MRYEKPINPRDAARFMETIRPDNGRLDSLPNPLAGRPLPQAGEGKHRRQLQ